MKFFISILIVGGTIWLVSQLVHFYQKSTVNSIDHQRAPATAVVSNPDDDLPPLAPVLEASLKQAMAGGANAMKEWLETNGTYLRDPRKAAIQLDFAQILARSDPAGAKRLYFEVKGRNPQGAAVSGRLQKLAKLFE